MYVTDAFIDTNRLIPDDLSCELTLVCGSSDQLAKLVSMAPPPSRFYDVITEIIFTDFIPNLIDITPFSSLLRLDILTASDAHIAPWRVIQLCPLQHIRLRSEFDVLSQLSYPIEANSIELSVSIDNSDSLSQKFSGVSALRLTTHSDQFHFNLDTMKELKFLDLAASPGCQLIATRPVQLQRLTIGDNSISGPITSTCLRCTTNLDVALRFNLKQLRLLILPAFDIEHGDRILELPRSIEVKLEGTRLTSPLDPLLQHFLVNRQSTSDIPDFGFDSTTRHP